VHAQECGVLHVRSPYGFLLEQIGARGRVGVAVQPRTRECQFRRFAPPPGKSIATPPYSHSPQPGHVSMGLAEKCLRSEGCAVQASFADRLATKLSVLIELDTVNSALPAPTRSCCAHRAAVSSSAFCLLVLQHCTLVGSIFRFYLVHVMYAVFATKPRAHARVRGASYGIGRRVSSTMHALVGTELTVPPCRCFGTTSCTGAHERARIRMQSEPSAIRSYGLLLWLIV